MFRLTLVLSLLWLAGSGAWARHHHYASSDEGTLKVGGLQFTIPDSWQKQPPETSARAGQWSVPSDLPGPPVEVVVFFFGPGVGGTAEENIKTWGRTMTGAAGAPAPSPQKRTAGGHTVTEVLVTGTYAEPGPEPGLPPVDRPGYALWGAVLESGGGNLYWRATGPAGPVAALAPVLDHVIDSIRPLPAEHAPSP